MKKALFDLSIEEFVRVLCGKEEIYELEITYYPLINNDNTDVVRGTYQQIKKVFMDIDARTRGKNLSKQLFEQFEQSYFDYSLELSLLDIYNYLEYKTSGFQKDKCKWLRRDMTCFHDMVIEEERIQEINERAWKNDKSIKYLSREEANKRIDEMNERSLKWRKKNNKPYDIIIPKLDEDVTRTTDYEASKISIYGIGYDSLYYHALIVLDQKIKLSEHQQQDKATTTGATESEQPQSTGTIQQEPILPSELDTTGQAGTEHQQEQAKPTRRRGRPRRTIKDHMKNDADGSKLQKLHAVLKGKSGKVVALTILTAIEKGWMDKPTYEEVKNEFGDIGSKAGYNRYFDKRMFTEEEITGALNSLK